MKVSTTVSTTRVRTACAARFANPTATPPSTTVYSLQAATAIRPCQSSRDRHPSLSGNQDQPNWIIDFRNNIVYNWSNGGTANVGDAQINLINNIFRPGPESGTKLPIAMKAHTAYAAHGYMSGNVFDERPEFTADNYAAMDMERWGENYKYLGTLEHWKVDKIFDTGANAPTTHSAEEARRLVLAGAGASLVRDAVDRRLINDIKNRTG
ncbi:MAG: hypothetical protein ACYSWQ_25215, partial [Planctomycetota bacterium]